MADRMRLLSICCVHLFSKITTQKHKTERANTKADEERCRTSAQGKQRFPSRTGNFFQAVTQFLSRVADLAFGFFLPIISHHLSISALSCIQEDAAPILKLNMDTTC